MKSSSRLQSNAVVPLVLPSTRSFASSLSLALGVWLGWSSQASAAACCGGGFAAPAMIAGDDRAQITTSYSYSEVAVDSIDSQGVWHTWDHHQHSQTLRLEGAKIIDDRWQTGFAIPIITRTRLEQSSSGLGDVAISGGYEYLPDWDYNPYRPKGIGFLQLTLPTGRAKAESENGGLDSRGNGFLEIGVGTLLTKAIHRWDVVTSLEAHRGFEKPVSNSQIQGTLQPGFGGSFAIGAGYNTAHWRWGSSISWTYEDPISIRGTPNIDGASERFATATASASYLANDDWAGTLSYADQTLFGSPVNTSLAKSVALQVQRRWGR